MEVILLINCLPFPLVIKSLSYTYRYTKNDFAFNHFVFEIIVSQPEYYLACLNYFT